ncbi:hypothetical protein PS685_04360 [Pseudomonas fluorescens]|uniref:Uncharacterized protein n=1 Tax=Pseudomonas fluorescens TaxID=294 RepID=A0A5E6ZCS0_PSEFL|nr:hypothetical protein PS685_04360 [Pseudomonas fluorescens]
MEQLGKWSVISVARYGNYGAFMKVFRLPMLGLFYDRPGGCVPMTEYVAAP